VVTELRRGGRFHTSFFHSSALNAITKELLKRCALAIVIVKIKKHRFFLDHDVYPVKTVTCESLERIRDGIKRNTQCGAAMGLGTDTSFHGTFSS